MNNEFSIIHFPCIIENITNTHMLFPLHHCEALNIFSTYSVDLISVKKSYWMCFTAYNYFFFVKLEMTHKYFRR